MDEQSRLTYLTRHYYELQGTRAIPAWLSILVLQAEPHTSNGIGWAMVFAAIGLMGLWSWLAGRYYERQFGRVESGWISIPTSRIYWFLVMGVVVFSFYRVIFDGYNGGLPYVFALVWSSPVFNGENPLLRRVYYAAAGAVVVGATYWLQTHHGGSRPVIAIQCIVLVVLGVADHMLLMSLRGPAHEGAVA